MFNLFGERPNVANRSETAHGVSYEMGLLRDACRVARSPLCSLTNEILGWPRAPTHTFGKYPKFKAPIPPGRFFHDPSRAFLPPAYVLREFGIDSPDPYRQSSALLYVVQRDVMQALCQEFDREIAARFTPQSGRVDIGERWMSVTPGVRRGPALDEATIARGLFVHQLGSPAWNGQIAFPTLYSEVLAPHFLKQARNDPFVWAHERLSVHLGYAHALAGGDYPPPFAEHAYTVLAPLVCNGAPSALSKMRRYAVTESLSGLMQAAHGDRPLIPELVIFCAENVDALSGVPQLVELLQPFAAKVTGYLENGLNIDRVSELFRAHAQRCLDVTEALRHTLQVVAGVYGGSERPWWFKEDCSLVPPEGLPERWTDAGRTVAETIAHAAGFAYLDTISAFASGAYEWYQLGIPLREVITATHLIVRQYGIGNVSRAEGILKFGTAALAETSQGQRSAQCARFLRTLEHHAPLSPLMSALEGPGADFDKPGMLSLVAGQLGEQVIDRDRLHDHRVSLELHRRIADVVNARPYSERAALPPALSFTPTIRGLLSGGEERRLLPAPAAHEVASVPMRPFAGWVEFDAQARAECGADMKGAAHIYLTIFAMKFPDPLRPPRGFLGFLAKFSEIRDPDMEYTFMVHPNEREAQAQKNREVFAERTMVISSILDGWLLGLLSWQDATEVFEWICAEPTDAERRELEIELLWRWRDRGFEHYSDAEHVAVDDLALRRRSERLLSERHQALFEEQSQSSDPYRTPLSPDLQRRIAMIDAERGRIEARRVDLLAEYQPPRENAILDPRGDRPEIRLQRADHDDTVIESPLTAMHDSIEQAIANRGPKEGNARLFRLRAELDVLRFLVETAGRGLLSRDVVRQVFPEVLRRLRSEPLDAEVTIASERRVFRTAQEFDELNHMLRLGVLSREELEGALRKPQGEQQLRLLVRSVASTIESFTKASRLLSRMPWETMLAAGGQQALAELARHRADLALQLEHSALPAVAVQRLFHESRWSERYDAAREAMDDLVYPTLARAFPLPAVLSREQLRSPALVIARANRDVLVWSQIGVKLAQMDLPQAIAAAHSTHAALAGPDGDAMPVALRSTTYLQRLREERKSAALIVSAQLGEVAERVIAARTEAFGLLPIGGKIHVVHAVDEDRLVRFQSVFGFGSTHFRLLHAGKSLLIPPGACPAEMKLAIAMLEQEGIVNTEEAELQVGGPGRLAPPLCAVLGAAVILASDVNVRYDRRSFDTTHNEATNFRVVVYDRGGPREEFPFSTGRRGRTDILARRSFVDIDHFHLLFSVLSSGVDQGPFGQLSHEFCAAFRAILVRHGLAGVLDESWVHENDTTIDEPDHEGGLRHFDQAVKPCVDAWERCADEAEAGVMGGVVGDVKQLFDWLKGSVRIVQQQMLSDPTYEGHRRLLFESIGRIRDV